MCGTTFSVQLVKTMENNEPNRDIHENDRSKAMDSKREVAQSNDEKTDQDFPGYPHYPAREDIMDQRTDSKRVDVDVENLPGNRNTTGVNQRFPAAQERQRPEGRSGSEEDTDENLR